MNKGRFVKAVRNLHVLFIIIVAVLLVIELGIIALLAYIFDMNEYIELSKETSWFVILIWIVSSIMMGLIVSFGFAKIFMDPIRKIIHGMTQLSDGIYDVEIDLGSKSALKELSDCYNNLAKELKKNEMLSADFVNNFSHEFKTPLSSINGLISLMKQPNFPNEKKLEYLNIIEEETNRLTSLTTNILNLSKIENQTIVPDKEKFNISEQIRHCVLLLEKEWAKKELNLSLDFDEYYVKGNMDLLKQVWVNLLDNAIKYSYNKSDLQIEVSSDKDNIIVVISNKCNNVSEQDLSNIFQKFYQIKSLDKKKGNGLGLSIVKKIVELHKGNVKATSIDNTFTVEVRLPRV